MCCLCECHWHPYGLILTYRSYPHVRAIADPSLNPLLRPCQNPQLTDLAKRTRLHNFIDSDSGEQQKSMSFHSQWETNVPARAAQHFVYPIRHRCKSADRQSQDTRFGHRFNWVDGAILQLVDHTSLHLVLSLSNGHWLYLCSDVYSVCDWIGGPRANWAVRPSCDTIPKKPALRARCRSNTWQCQFHCSHLIANAEYKCFCDISYEFGQTWGP